MSNRGKSTRFVAIGTLAAIALLLLVVSDALARAGGGGGYRGGGRSSGGGSGSGSGGSDGLFFLVFQLLRFCVYHPYVGVPLLLIVVYGIWYFGRHGKVTLDASTIRRGNAAAARLNVRTVADAIHTADPAFDPEAFLARAGVAFGKIQHAWAAQNLADVRPFISDAVHERFSLQFDEQRALGYRNHMADVTVSRADLAHARSDAEFDELSVRFVASAVDQNVSLADGKVLSGSAYAQPFEEVWTFLRRRGATTTPGKPGLIEGSCPNCGAPVEMNQSDNCQYCAALLRSGRYDWVLVEITQASEWETVAGGPVAGELEMRRRDPEFNRQELEDRASVVFWRMAAVQRLGRVEPLRKVAFDALLDRIGEDFRLAQSRPRRYVGERAVGAVRTLGVIVADPGNFDGGAFDRALVEVRWMGNWFTAHPDGRLVRSGESAINHLLLVLARRAGTATVADKSASSAHCPTCGAPEAGGSSGACQYCGTAMNDGSKTWTLEEAVPLDAERARELLAAAGARQAALDEPAEVPTNGAAAVHADHPAPASVLAWMVHVACADGEVHDRERRMLQMIAARYHVPPARLDQLIAAARAGAMDLPEPQGRDEAEAHLKGMTRVALADGRVSSEEAGLLTSAGRQLGLSDHDVRMLINRTRKDAVAEARGQIRAAKEAGRNGSG